MIEIKSVIIRQNGKKIIHLKRKAYGVDAEIMEDLGEIKITCVLESGERIIISNK